MKSKTVAAVLLLLLSAATLLHTPARAEVVRVDVQRRELFADGHSFGRSGPYEKLAGRLYLEVDPEDPANDRIVDLDLAPRNDRGRVEFWSDFFLLKPVDPRRGNRRLLYDVHNRGNKLALETFNGARSNDPTGVADAGDGFLMVQGYSVLWTGWCGEVVDDGKGRLLAGLPIAGSPDQPVTGKTMVEICVDERVFSQPFYWSPWGTSAAYPTVDLNDPSAKLTMRPRRDQPAVEIPREAWAFARWEDGQVVEDPTSLFVRDGFKPGWLYELVYTAKEPRVAGLGLAGLRDAVAYFRYADEGTQELANPLSGMIDHAYIFGISQSGRLIHQFLYDGFNGDPAGRPVFDGAIMHVAGAGRGLFNHRFGMATVYGTFHNYNLFPTESFPFATGPQRDPVTGEQGDSLSRLRAKQCVPKIFFVQTSTEYWNRGASLLHTDVLGRRDLDVDPNVRIYLVAGAQHLGGGSSDRGICQNPRNILNDRPPVLRAMLVAMDRWASGTSEPPPSRYPKIADGTLIDVETFRRQFPAIPGVQTPSACYRPLRLDLGARWLDQGIADVVPPGMGEPFQTLVPAVDADGNEIAGIRLPDVAVPLATYTGWNLRAAEYGAEGVLAGLHGSYLLFPRTADDRIQTGDPRPAVRERYPSREVYLAHVTDAVLQLQAEGFLLEQDAIGLLKQAAAVEW